MNNFGYIRTGCAVPVVKLADPGENAKRICALIEKAVEEEVSLVVFPELCLTGYTCGDLFFQEILLKESEAFARRIAEFTAGRKITVVIGAPVRHNGRLYNCAIVLNDGRILGLVPKTYLPNYGEFCECRWFSSGSDFISKYGDDEAISNIRYAGFDTAITPNQLFKVAGATVGVEICEDVWTPIPRSSYLAIEGAQIIVNLSASNELVSKTEYRRQMILSQSAQRVLGYVYCSAGMGESTTDCVFGGSSIICENGLVLAEGKPFVNGPTLTVADIDIQKLEHRRNITNTFYGVTPDGTDVRGFRRFFRLKEASLTPETDFGKKLCRPLFPSPFVPSPAELPSKCETAFDIQATGLASRMESIGCRKVVIGISGGLDSTLALLSAVKAFDRMGWDRKGIIAVTMPGFGTSRRTKDNASLLMQVLGVTTRSIPISDVCKQHLKDIGHDGCTQDTTYENSQARERTQILMDLANMENALVIGTGDLSELALGWCTYSGDHISGYSINATIPKTLVRAMVSWAASSDMAAGTPLEDVLNDIVATPVSPELKGDGTSIGQLTEKVLGPYELHDFFLYYFVRHGFSPEKIIFLADKAFKGVHSREEIGKWMKVFIRRFFANQFKRSCAPDGPKVGPVSLGPRSDWKMPSDASSGIWNEKR